MSTQSFRTTLLLKSRTDANGETHFRLPVGEKLARLTAWTDDFRVGGYLFIRNPNRDPAGDAFYDRLNNCHDQTIRFLDADDNSPVPNLPFQLVIGTGWPNFDITTGPATFPHSRMTTDKQEGEAICRWFPSLETHRAFVEIIDPCWATPVENSKWETADDGALVMTLKRQSRKPFVGKITSDHFDVRGLLVEIKSAQGVAAYRPDGFYAFTDDAGNFTADVLPGATYTVCVNDSAVGEPHGST